MPDNSYCTYADSCFGVECCVTVKMSLFLKVFKTFVRYEPCQELLYLGFADFEREFNLTDFFSGMSSSINDGKFLMSVNMKSY